MSGPVQQAAKPVMRWMTVVLTNGASLRMPTAALKVKPFIATQDLLQHNLWTVKVAGADPGASERSKKVDFSDFYKKYAR